MNDNNAHMKETFEFKSRYLRCEEQEEIESAAVLQSGGLSSIATGV